MKDKNVQNPTMWVSYCCGSISVHDTKEDAARATACWLANAVRDSRIQKTYPDFRLTIKFLKENDVFTAARAWMIEMLDFYPNFSGNCTFEECEVSCDGDAPDLTGL